MKNLELETIVLGKKKGEFSKVQWHKDMKTLKGISGKVEKISEVVARFGVEYDNIKQVKFDRFIGEKPEENQGLTWGTWKKYPYFIEHKGNDYLRISLVKGNKVNSKYYLDGKEIDRGQAQSLCLASEFKSGQDLQILTINTNNILSIK